MQVAGLKRSDYLLSGQFCYGHSVTNWKGTYDGLRKKVDKFTDPSFRNVKNNGKFTYRSKEDWSYFEEEENFNFITPGIFNV